MMLRRFVCLVAGVVITLNLPACISSNHYPASWPQTVKGEQIGNCPAIAGTYWNAGVSEPGNALVYTLTELLGLSDGDYVLIEQTPDTLTASAWQSDTRIATITYTRLSVTSSEAWKDSDLTRAQWFNCPLDLLSGRQFTFPHLEGVHAWFPNFNISNVSKTADGSLVVMLQDGGVSLRHPPAVADIDRIWYKFKAVN